MHLEVEIKLNFAFEASHSNLVPRGMQVDALVELSIDIRAKWTLLLVIANLLGLLVQIVVIHLHVDIAVHLEYLVHCLRLLAVQIAFVWGVLQGTAIYVKWTGVELPERVLLEVFLLTEVVGLLTLPGNLLGHHFNIDFLCDDVGVLERVANQVVGHAVCQLEGTRGVVVILAEEEVSALVLLLSDLLYFPLIEVVAFFDSPLELEVSILLWRCVIAQAPLLIVPYEIGVVGLLPQIHEVLIHIIAAFIPGADPCIGTR